jgi:hypothetical protein
MEKNLAPAASRCSDRLKPMAWSLVVYTAFAIAFIYWSKAGSPIF